MKADSMIGSNVPLAQNGVPGGLVLDQFTRCGCPPGGYFPGSYNFYIRNEISVFWATVSELAFFWTVVFISLFRVSDSKWILEFVSSDQSFHRSGTGVPGTVCSFYPGMATEFTWNSLLPSMNLSSLAYVSVILFNFMGFEVLNSFTSEMENPRRQVPQAIVAGGIAIAFLYIFSSFGIGVAIPAEEINTSNGLVESLQLLTGTTMGTFITIMGTLFLISLSGQYAFLVLWSQLCSQLCSQKQQHACHIRPAQ